MRHSSISNLAMHRRTWCKGPPWRKLDTHLKSSIWPFDLLPLFFRAVARRVRSQKSGARIALVSSLLTLLYVHSASSICIRPSSHSVVNHSLNAFVELRYPSIVSSSSISNHSPSSPPFNSKSSCSWTRPPLHFFSFCCAYHRFSSFLLPSPVSFSLDE